MKQLILLISFLFCSELTAQEFPPYSNRHKRLVQSISFTPDGKQMYFTLPHREYLEAKGESITEETPRLAIYSAKLVNGTWSEPEMISFGGQYKEYEPTLSPDGELLLFNSNRPIEGTEPLAKNNIWFSRKVAGKWSEPQYIPAINTIEFEESYATITADNQLFFLNETPVGDKFQYSIFTTKFDGKATQPAKRVVEIDQPQGASDPWVSPDASYLIYTKFGENWRETCDLYISFHSEKGWSKPIVLEELNSSGPDFAVAVSPDELWIYYRKNFEFIKVPFQPILKEARGRSH